MSGKSDNRAVARVTVVERFIEGKDPRSGLCEDAIHIDENFAAVIDGATTTRIVFEDGRTPGRVASEILIPALGRLQPDLDASAAIEALDTTIAEWYRSAGLYQAARLDVQKRVTASAVIFSLARREIWMIGDCQALVDAEHLTNEKRTDSLTEEVRAYVIESELAQGATVEDLIKDDTGRMVIDDLIRRQRMFQNRGLGSPYDYFVLDGFLPSPPPVVVHRIPDDARTVVLASDGYPELHASLQATESALRDILHDDPLLYRRWKSTKGFYPGNRSFDDRAYVRMRLEPGQ